MAVGGPSRSSPACKVPPPALESWPAGCRGSHFPTPPPQAGPAGFSLGAVLTFNRFSMYAGGPEIQWANRNSPPQEGIRSGLHARGWRFLPWVSWAGVRYSPITAWLPLRGSPSNRPASLPHHTHTLALLRYGVASNRGRCAGPAGNIWGHEQTPTADARPQPVLVPWAGAWAGCFGHWPAVPSGCVSKRSAVETDPPNTTTLPPACPFAGAPNTTRARRSKRVPREPASRGRSAPWAGPATGWPAAFPCGLLRPRRKALLLSENVPGQFPVAGLARKFFFGKHPCRAAARRSGSPRVQADRLETAGPLQSLQGGESNGQQAVAGLPPRPQSTVKSSMPAGRSRSGPACCGVNDFPAFLHPGTSKPGSRPPFPLEQQRRSPQASFLGGRARNARGPVPGLGLQREKRPGTTPAAKLGASASHLISKAVFGRSRLLQTAEKGKPGQRGGFLLISKRS